MSLLMDALRKAEDAKRQADSASPAYAQAAPELTLEPLNRSAAASPLPDLAQHSAALDADLSAVAAGAPIRPRALRAASAAADASGREAAERQAARNVFAAKAPARSRRGPWLAIAAVGAGAALAIGAYFWWQLQSVASVRPPPAPPVPLPAIPPPHAAVTAPTTSAVPQTTNAPPDKQAPAAPVVAPAATAPEPPPLPVRAVTPGTVTRAETLAAKRRTTSVSPAPVAASADGSPRLSKGRQPAAPVIERAYDALQAGRLDSAQNDYEQVLRNDPKNSDALLGLATIATRQGRPEQAQTYYLRALEADPADATAQAGLINGRGQSDPAQSESRLKSALEAQPESSALHFALGNLYSRQSRWSEAQQAYFRAYATEPDNADIIYNLAVSLDHLRQNKLAAQYYQMALTAARGKTTLFDSGQARNRIQELQP